MESAAALKLDCDDDDDEYVYRYDNDDPNDPTYYPVVEKLGEDLVQMLATDAFRPLLEDYLAHLGMHAMAGHDQLMYYVQGDPTAAVSPDIYVMPGIVLNEIRGRRLGCWKKWQGNGVPSFALEIMSHDNPKKDDRQSPARHDALGTKELIVFDPYADETYDLPRPRTPRIRFRIFRRNAAGRLVLVHTTNDLMIRSEALGCHLRIVGNGNLQRVRIMTGPNGETLFPTRAEAEAQRADAQAKLANEQTKRADEHSRRADAAEAEVERLRAELAALKQVQR